MTFFATDICGNQISTTGLIVIGDTQAPALTCPADITLECGDPANAGIISNWLSSAQAVDLCELDIIVTNNYADSFDIICGQTGVYTVTFTAVDGCNNDTSCISTITIADQVPPVVTTFPADTIVECDGLGNTAELSSWLANNGGMLAIDNCDITLEYTNAAQAQTDNCGGTSETPYIFTVTDACGNTTTAIASFIIQDLTPPTLMIPADLTVECDGAGNTAEIEAWLATAFATDICDASPLVSSQLSTVIDSCGGTGSRIYTFTATDACGNVSTGIGQVSIEDHTIPTIICPADLTLECGDSNNDLLIANWLNSAAPEDICSEVTVSNNFAGTLPANCGGTVAVTFIATDGCGNQASCTANITMDDTTDPVFLNCPADTITVNTDIDVCGANVIFSTPIALDQCDTLVLVSQTIGLTSGTAFPIGTTEIQFVAMDDCGNTDTCSFVVLVVDSDVPTILCPSNDIVVDADAGDMYLDKSCRKHQSEFHCRKLPVGYFL